MHHIKHSSPVEWQKTLLTLFEAELVQVTAVKTWDRRLKFGLMFRLRKELNCSNTIILMIYLQVLIAFVQWDNMWLRSCVIYPLKYTQPTQPVREEVENLVWYFKASLILCDFLHTLNTKQRYAVSTILMCSHTFHSIFFQQKLPLLHRRQLNLANWLLPCCHSWIDIAASTS